MVTALASRRLQSRLTQHFAQRRWNSTYQPPEPPNRHREFYKTFARPIGKNFLIAVVTFQVIYLSWLKLESLETKKEKEGEIQSLEGELKSLTSGKSAS